MKKMSEGAEAVVYSIKMFGKELLVKTRNRKRYRIERLDTKIRTERTKSEARAMIKAALNNIPVPKVEGVGRFSILMERLDGKLLKDSTVPASLFNGIGTTLAKLHEVGISHGDFTPANILVHKGSPYMIDFGLAEMNSGKESKALDLLLMKRSVDSKRYRLLERGYASASKESKEILGRLAEIEERGRYQSRTLQ